MSRLAAVLAFTDEHVAPAVRWLPQRTTGVERASWSLPGLTGRLIELSGHGASAALSLAFSLVLDAQRRGESVAWIACHGSSFFPPDAAAGGIDLARLPVVFAPDPPAAARAGERLLRSGGFGLVVIDLICPTRSTADAPTAAARARPPAAPPQPLLARLAGLADRHDALVVVLTDKAAERPSLGAPVSLRAAATRLTPLPPQRPGRYACRLEAIKDKRRAPGWSHEEFRLGPPGL